MTRKQYKADFVRRMTMALERGEYTPEQRRMGYEDAWPDIANTIEDDRARNRYTTVRAIFDRALERSRKTLSA